MKNTIIPVKLKIMKYALFFTVFVVLITSCSKDDEVSNNYEPIQLDLKSKALVEASNQFGFDLFKSTIAHEESSTNCMVSPLSVSQALGMTWNGAAGETRTEMTHMLGFDPDDEAQLNTSNQTIRKALLNADRKVEMNIANSIWYRKDYSVNSDFIQVNQSYYEAEVSGLDFTRAEESKRIINGWVNDQTKGRIPEIVDDISGDHVMFLINAVYFKGQWKYEFKKDQTAQESFHLADGSTVVTDMMKQATDLQYFTADNCRGIAMPYGNGHFEMVVILPNEDVTLSTLVEDLDDQQWNDYLNAMTELGVEVWLPKFTYACKIKLNAPLADLGMQKAFTPGVADFSNIGPGGLVISEVKHKTFIEVNEEGSEAAAVTSVEIIFTSAGGGGSPLLFKVDRPFLFAIREKDTGAILFLGQVYNPAG